MKEIRDKNIEFIKLSKEDIVEKIIELNYDLLQSFYKGDRGNIKVIKDKTNSLINQYLKNDR